MRHLLTLCFPRFVHYLMPLRRQAHSASPPVRHSLLASDKVTLHSGLKGTRRGLSYVRESIKLTVRSVLNYQVTRQWLQHWNSTPLLADIARSSPALLKKIYRPYMTKRLPCHVRLAILLSHYDFINRHELGELVLSATKQPVTLSRFDGKSGRSYHIELVAVKTMEREGELVFQLVSQGSVLFSVAFTFFEQHGILTVAIGCLQGGRETDSLEQIRLATRDMYGLRPKTLMVRLVQQVGYQLGCSDLLLVGNKNRVVTQPLRKGIVFADYDTTWQELLAEQRPDHDFQLPCKPLAEPDFLALASSKRSEAKKRFALLSSITQLTCQGVQSPEGRPHALDTGL